MKLIGLTGGIGSGKTTVAKMFEDLGVPIYYADLEAKRIMKDDTEVKRDLIKAFGDSSYNDGHLNRKYLADIVFNNKDQLKIINQIVHPVVGKDFMRWAKEQKSPYVIQESALIFENDKADLFDSIISVTAPLTDRIERVRERDGLNKNEILKRMQSQSHNEDIIKKSQFTIINTKLQETKNQVFEIFETLNQLYEN